MTQQPTIDFLPDRLNAEPPIFLGLTHSEMFLLLKVGIGLWVPLCMVIAFLLGKTVLGFGLGFMLAIGTVAVGGKVMQRLKRGRPEGYHERQIKIALQDRGLSHPGFIRYSGSWAIQRTLSNSNPAKYHNSQYRSP